jgi:aminoglycoside/choline kinase family phosphotransferase
MEQRITSLKNWARREIADILGDADVEISMQHLSGDASFRTYYRVDVLAVSPPVSFIVADSPPTTEDNESFVKIGKTLREGGLNTPEVFSVDLQRGFILQQDFGDKLYLQALNANYDAPDEIDRLYRLAIDSLVKLQKNVDRSQFPAFDQQRLYDEMSLFRDWFCEKFLALELDEQDLRIINEGFQFLGQQAAQQDQVAVHRDYHSRNLMIPESDKDTGQTIPGVIDFQDAVSGAYTYDLVSLLRDCYISWPPSYVELMALYYKEQAEQAGVITPRGTDSFIRDFDLMGLQRNLKVIGIFSRLYLRDNKSSYLADIPQVIRYFLDVACQYQELDQFVNWFKATVLPVASDKLSSGELCEQ